MRLLTGPGERSADEAFRSAIEVEILSGGIRLVRVRGRLDPRELRRVFDGLLAAARLPVVVEWGEHAVLDAEAVSALVHAAYAAGEADIGFALVGIDAEREQILATMGRSALFEIHPSVAAAVPVGPGRGGGGPAGHRGRRRVCDGGTP
ncbi:hypothetical protein ACVGVM_03840 [Pseudonocardia bannensis]|uniref:STAS domain-containing protein n=1 Tax=Pseudonocardia bannensis TaxID=630973 RepID=A0A848DN56_9PSEU|nr:hypothetical protein [Pseudonocardia bannensis]NMH94182.1 hypothetical protein [Pseudonocardia bannensis]